MDAEEALVAVLDNMELTYEIDDYGEEGWDYYTAARSPDGLAPEILDGLRALGFQISPL